MTVHGSDMSRMGQEQSTCGIWFSAAIAENFLGSGAPRGARARGCPACRDMAYLTYLFEVYHALVVTNVSSRLRIIKIFSSVTHCQTRAGISQENTPRSCLSLQNSHMTEKTRSRRGEVWACDKIYPKIF